MVVFAEKTGILDDLRAAPGHLMRRCQQIAVSVFLDECRPWDLTPLQFAVLAELNRDGPDDQVGLGGALALDRTTIGVVVKKLEERGLVERSVSEKDRRSKPVSITKKGAGLIRVVLPSAEAAQDRMLAPLTASERAQFMRLLGKMANGNNSESRAPLRR
jgi:DNA-binding MarR family transcriptional regulator